MERERNINVFIEAKREIGVQHEGHHLIEFFFLRQLQLTSSFSPLSSLYLLSFSLACSSIDRRKIKHPLTQPPIGEYVFSLIIGRLSSQREGEKKGERRKKKRKIHIGDVKIIELNGDDDDGSTQDRKRAHERERTACAPDQFPDVKRLNLIKKGFCVLKRILTSTTFRRRHQ